MVDPTVHALKQMFTFQSIKGIAMIVQTWISIGFSLIFLILNYVHYRCYISLLQC